MSRKIIGKQEFFSMVDFAFSSRIKAILKELGLNQTAFASKLNLSQGVISEFTSGARLPSKEFIFGLSKLGISLDWFLTGIGDMYLPSPLASTSQWRVGLSGGSKVPLLRQKVSCGPGVDWQDETNIVEYIDVFDLIPRLKIKRMFALCVEGSSMLGAGIRNGDYVLFDSAQDLPPHDGIYVFALDGEVYCKRLEFDMEKIKIYSVRVADLEKAELLRTLNVEDIDFPERFSIFGRVLYWVHPNLE
jgi:transcriptional regulator with XRE-family HTH domain